MCIKDTELYLPNIPIDYAFCRYCVHIQHRLSGIHNSKENINNLLNFPSFNIQVCIGISSFPQNV